MHEYLVCINLEDLTYKHFFSSVKMFLEHLLLTGEPQPWSCSRSKCQNSLKRSSCHAYLTCLLILEFIWARHSHNRFFSLPVSPVLWSKQPLYIYIYIFFLLLSLWEMSPLHVKSLTAYIAFSAAAHTTFESLLLSNRVFAIPIL